MDSHFSRGLLNGAVAGMAINVLWWVPFLAFGRFIGDALFPTLDSFQAGAAVGAFIAFCAAPPAVAIANAFVPLSRWQSSCQFESRTNTVRAQNEK